MSTKKDHKIESEPLGFFSRAYGQRLCFDWNRREPGTLPFLGLRVFWQNAKGEWFPRKGKGVTVHVDELPRVHEALIEAARRALASGEVRDVELKARLKVIAGS